MMIMMMMMIDHLFFVFFKFEISVSASLKKLGTSDGCQKQDPCYVYLELVRLLH